MRRMGMLAAALLSLSPLAAAKIKVGEPAPDFSLTTVDKEVVKLSDLRGQVVVLNFWATWCAPCKRELPLLDAYYKIQQPHGMRVFAVATEDSLAPSDLKKKIGAIISIPIVKRMKGPYASLDGVPTNFVIDRSGIVRYAKAGAFDLNDLNAILVPLLNEAAPTS